MHEAGELKKRSKNIVQKNKNSEPPKTMPATAPGASAKRVNVAVRKT